MSKDYRHQREQLDSVEEDEFHTKRTGHKRQQSAKAKQMRDIQRRDKQRRLSHEGI